MSTFNQGVSSVPVILNSSNVLVFGNTSSGNALSVQQLGAGSVFATSNASGTVGLFVNPRSNVGVGTTNPQQYFHVSSGTIGGVPTSAGAGSDSNVMIRYTWNSIVLDHGCTNSGTVWMQVRQPTTSLGTTFPLALNPIGGNVGIGTTSPGQQLDVFAAAGGYGYIGNSGGSLFMNCATGNSIIMAVNGVSRAYMVNGSFTATTDNTMDLGGGTGQRWKAVYAVNGTIQTSDARYKDSTILQYGLNEVLQANTILYSWKTQADLPDTDPEKNFKYFGVCADELVSIMPELCYNENPDVAVQINYAELVPVCINAIKELSAQNKTLEERLAALEGTIGSRLGA